MSTLVCIDPGHGGKDHGATNNGIKEKDLTLEISKKLDDILNYWSGFETIMTREKDKYLNLSKRAEFANKNNADIFISVHINSAENPDATGIEVFHYKNSEEGKRLATITQNKLIENTEQSDRGVKTANFAVLRKTKMIAILPELGFLSNEEIASRIDNDYIKFIKAFSLADAIREYIR